MADGYARVSGRPGVCFTITGPGVTNIATAMAQAYADSIPMLVVSSQNRRGETGTGRGFLHEMPDQAAFASQVAGVALAIEEPAQLPEALARVFARLSGCRPRPAYLEIPRDVLAADATGLAMPAGESPRTAGPPAWAAVAAAASALRAATRPVLLAGGGALGARTELRRLAEHLDAPVVMTINARGMLPPGHPLAVPFSPSLAPVRALVAGADVVLAVGTEIGPTDYDMYSLAPFPAPAQLLRIDIDAEQVVRNAVPAIALVGDARETLAVLIGAELGSRQEREGARRAASACQAALAGLSGAMRREIGFLEVIRDSVPGAILVGDSTQPVYAGNLGYAAATPGSWFNSATGFGTLGYALPASTGASLGAPERPVVCLVGDGGVQFSLGELAVPRDVDAWLAIVVWNNHGYREIRTSMLDAGLEPAGVDVRPPDFAQLARAYGYAYHRIDGLEPLARVLAEFAARRQVLVLEVDAAAFE
jgi:acetolactate synthase-1/2/3 large subunit